MDKSGRVMLISMCGRTRAHALMNIHAAIWLRHWLPAFESVCTPESTAVSRCSMILPMYRSLSYKNRCDSTWFLFKILLEQVITVNKQVICFTSLLSLSLRCLFISFTNINTMTYVILNLTKKNKYVYKSGKCESSTVNGAQKNKTQNCDNHI